MLPKAQFHSLSLMNPGIVILEYANAIRAEQNPLIEKSCDSVYFGSLGTFSGNMTLLNLDLTN